MSISIILDKNKLIYGLPEHKVKMARNEQVTVPAGSSITMLEVAGSGTVLSIWCALRGKFLHRDAVIRVYVDGETAPSVEFDVGTLGLHWLNGAAVYSCRHVRIEEHHDDSAQVFDSGVLFKFPIFYGSSVRIELVNPSELDGVAWTEVVYTPDFTLPLRMKSVARTWINKVTVPAGGSHEFLNINGIAGILVFNSIVAQGATSLKYLESDINIYIDGEETPSISSTGWEDWFGSCFYFTGGLASTPFMYVSVKDEASRIFAAALDILELWGGIKFDNGLRVVVDSSESNTDYDMSYIWLYYQKV